jgi:hypothetical protein
MASWPVKVAGTLPMADEPELQDPEGGTAK